MHEDSVCNPQDAIVLVTSEDPSNMDWGTSFVVYANDNVTYLLTCSHVVSDLGGATMIKAGDRHATVVALGSDDIDIAILRVDGVLEHTPLQLHTLAKTGT